MSPHEGLSAGTRSSAFPPIRGMHAFHWLLLLLIFAWPPPTAASQESTGPLKIDMTGKTCLDAGCHADLAATRLIHPPVMQGDCDRCHTLLDQGTGGSSPTSHQFSTTTSTLQLCGQCHVKLEEKLPVQHEPFHMDCTVCHNPHGGGLRYYVRAEKPDQLCMDCHSDLLTGMRYHHGPIAYGSCLVCHTAHDSEYEGLLAREPARVCLYCHVEFRSGAERAGSVHEPVKESCYECHNPHGGNVRGFFPKSQAEMCRSCHESTFHQMESTKFSHAAMMENRQCSDCHEPHWGPSTQLLRKPSMEICLGCHDETRMGENGRVVAPVGLQITEAKFLHGPIAQHDCTPCHASHGSDDPRLMEDAFPQRFYADYTSGTYALCFGCHDSAILNPERPYATGFRNGTENLHAFHVVAQKGRSCRACHQEHASDKPFHIRDWVQYGNWQMQISYAATTYGGTCSAGCHTARGYDRLKPIDNELRSTIPQPPEGRPPRPPDMAVMAYATTATVHLAPGTPAPDFTLMTLDGGSSVTLSKLTGVRLLAFVRPNQRFTSETLKLCRELPDQLPPIRENLSALLIWVGEVPPDRSQQLQYGFSRPWSILHDPQGEVARAWRMVVSPTFYLVNSAGIITSAFPAWHPMLDRNLIDALRGDLDLPALEATPTTGTMLTPEERAFLYSRLARELERQGRNDEAEAIREKARALRKQLPGAPGDAGPTGERQLNPSADDSTTQTLPRDPQPRLPSQSNGKEEPDGF